MQFPLLGLARDFHPLDNAHAERTNGNAGRSLRFALGVGVLALEATPTIQEVGFFSIENYTI